MATEPTTQVYYSTLDLFPQQTVEHNRLYKFFDNLRAGVLTTTKCTKCGRISWPPRVVCPDCYSDQLEWVEFPKRGKVDVYTVQWAGHPPGFDLPLILVMLEFPGMPTILSHAVETKAEEIEDGCEMELVVLPVDRDRVTYGFRKVRG